MTDMHIHVEKKYNHEDQGLPYLEIKSEEKKFCQGFFLLGWEAAIFSLNHRSLTH